MKLAIAAAVLATAAFASPALAADSGKVDWYGNLGYSYNNFSDGNLGAVTGRLGGRSNNWGVEGEVSTGAGDTTISGVKVKLQDQYAIYGVYFVPMQNGDLFARVGYGHTTLKASSGGFSGSGGDDNWNAGFGGQWFQGANGIRAEYTYSNFQNGGGHSNVYAISYVRKF